MKLPTGIFSAIWSGLTAGLAVLFLTEHVLVGILVAISVFSGLSGIILGIRSAIFSK